MRVLYFSQLKAVTGREMDQITLGGSITQAEFWQRIVALHPGLASHRESVRLALNEQYVSGADLFTDNDEVALIPPVSGG